MSEEQREHIVVIGAGHGGGSVVAFLRQFGFAGDITLIGAESAAPYQRPPLSKAWLKGETTLDALALRPAKFYEDQKINLRLGVAVTRIDADRHHVILANGDEVAYDRLILATGSDARKLPMAGADFGNVMALRALDDAERIKAALQPSKKLVIIGGGYVGLECAATARALGADVVVIERAPRLLERVASAQISAFLHRYHEEQGVTIVVNANLAAIEGDKQADAVRLEDGRRFECDALLVGVGAVPVTALAETAGLECDDGIVIDAECRTSNPDIFAIGDVARRHHPHYDRKLRLESVPNALEQARQLASVLVGRSPVAHDTPWFWSDQYSLKLQMAGMPFEVQETVVRGDPAAAKFAVFHLRDGYVVTVEAVNSPAEFMAGKKLISSRKVVDVARLTDTSVALAELIA
jgi:3-phenylpropionate/trans-cinnamate dioxygenase ferredoxin reductase subunit